MILWTSHAARNYTVKYRLSGEHLPDDVAACVEGLPSAEAAAAQLDY